MDKNACTYAAAQTDNFEAFIYFFISHDKKVTIRDWSRAIIMNAKNVLKNIFGAMNPKKEKPGNVNEVIEMLVTSAVSR